MQHLRLIPNYLIFLFLVFPLFNISAQDYLPEKPKVETSLYDNAGLLDKSEAGRLEQKLINYADSTSTQIVVVTIPSLNGNNIALYGTELAHKWGIGQQGKDNGVLLLVARDDRKMTIRTGYGVEHLLTDALSRRVIEQGITPHFKSGNYYQGLDTGTTMMMKILSGAYKNDGGSRSSGVKIPAFFIVLVIVVIIMILSQRKNRGGGNRGRRSGGFSLLDAIILSNAGRGGFGRSGGFGSSGGSFGGGGFGGGFGGGGFGGGGASGGW